MVIKETKKIDNKGRLIIPKAVLKELDIKSGDEFSFEITRGKNLLVVKETR